MHAVRVTPRDCMVAMACRSRGGAEDKEDLVAPLHSRLPYMTSPAQTLKERTESLIFCLSSRLFPSLC